MDAPSIFSTPEEKFFIQFLIWNENYCTGLSPSIIVCFSLIIILHISNTNKLSKANADQTTSSLQFILVPVAEEDSTSDMLAGLQVFSKDSTSNLRNHVMTQLSKLESTLKRKYSSKCKMQ